MLKSRGGTRDGEFVAYVYENDHKQIQKFVQQYPEIETGGDLFGLWKDERTVIIQQFIGPGKACKRTSTSFHQDIEYLHKVGSLITTEEGLCNVGEWHSHHQIGMPAPSGADRRTVFSNMPHLGLERFVLFIASIEGKGYSGKKRSRDVKLDDIKLRPFLFLDSAQDIVEGEIEIIPGSNPHRRNSRIGKEIEDGAQVPLNAKRTPTSSEENYGRTSKKSEKKKKAGKEGGKPAQHGKKDEPQTLLQEAEELAPTRPPQGEQPRPPSRETKPQKAGVTAAGKPAQQPRPPSRETKPQNAGVTEPYMDDESLCRKSRDDQQRAGREKDQYAERKCEVRGNETQRRDGFNNENRSPNPDPTAPGGRDYRSPPTSPPTSQMNTPQPFGTTEPWGPGTQGNMPPTTSAPTSFRQVWNASLHSGAAQGQGPGVQGNVSMPTHPPTSQPFSTPSHSGEGPHFGTAAGRGRGTQGQGNFPQPAYSPSSQQMHTTQPLQQTGSRDSQRNTPPTGGAYSSHQSPQPPDQTQQSSQRSTRGQGHSQGNMPHQSHAAERSSQTQAKDRSGNIPVGKITGKGLF